MSIDHSGGTPNLPLITRAQARKLGLKSFFTGKPCKNGHISKGRVNSGSCNRCKYLSLSPQRKVKRKKHLDDFKKSPRGRAMILFNVARHRSEKRGRPAPTITWQDILPSLERGTCDLSGLPFDFSVNNGRSPYSPSIDRIDSSKPYTKKNFRIILWAINSGCGDWGLETYLKIARAIK